jgi:4-hydroxybenzoate polyprenyltransferase
LPNVQNALFRISRPEFLPANSASLIIGFTWGLTLPTDIIWKVLVPLVLAFSVISLVAAYAAQINSLSDYELDLKDETKKRLVEAMAKFNKGKLKAAMVAEIGLSLFIVLLLVWLESKPAMVLLWGTAVFFAHSYSAKPLRLKSRGILAPITLMLVLSILPVAFVTYAFTAELTPLFWIFLVGHALTVYGVIVPAEIRDYFGDKRMGINTFTVQIGLTRASIMALILLSAGGILCGIGLTSEIASSPIPQLGVFIVAMAIAYVYILKKYWRLLDQSRQFAKASNSRRAILEQAIITISAENPKWITIVTQAIVIMCIVLLVSKVV